TVLEDIQPSNSLRLKRQRTLSFLKKMFSSSDNITKDVQTHKDGSQSDLKKLFSLDNFTKDTQTHKDAMNNNNRTLDEDINEDRVIEEGNNNNQGLGEDIALGEDIPPLIRKGIISIFSGLLGFNINNIIGAGIFVTPTSIWRLVQSPGTALMLWIAGGLISLFGSMIYVE
ncbi:21933_t:CDS:2, partial [Racocetra persica]